MLPARCSGLDPAKQQVRGLLADLARADGDRGQRGPVECRLGDVVEADDRDVAPGKQAAIGEAEHHAEGAEIVVANDGGRIAGSPRSSMATAPAPSSRVGRQLTVGPTGRP